MFVVRLLTYSVAVMVTAGERDETATITTTENLLI